MIPRGANALIDRRMGGWVPKRDVWLNYGDFREPFCTMDRDKPMVFTAWHRYAETSSFPELLIRPEDNLERLDLRCIAGLRIILYFLEWNERVAKLEERLKDYASEITVMSPCFGEDIGWRWDRENGQGKI